MKRQCVKRHSIWCVKFGIVGPIGVEVTAIFPIYVLHQTIIILVAYWMLDTGWSIGFKYIIIIISTLVGFVVMYEGFIKKIGSAGVLFGLKPKS